MLCKTDSVWCDLRVQCFWQVLDDGKCVRAKRIQKPCFWPAQCGCESAARANETVEKFIWFRNAGRRVSELSAPPQTTHTLLAWYKTQGNFEIFLLQCRFIYVYLNAMTVSVAIKGDALPDGTRANVVKALANGRAVRRVRVARKVSSTNSEKKCRVFIGANKFQASVESLLLRRKVFRMQIFAVRAPACDNRVLCRHSHTEPTPLTRITWLIIIAHRSCSSIAPTVIHQKCNGRTMNQPSSAMAVAAHQHAVRLCFWMCVLCFLSLRASSSLPNTPTRAGPFSRHLFHSCYVIYMFKQSPPQQQCLWRLPWLDCCCCKCNWRCCAGF